MFANAFCQLPAYLQGTENSDFCERCTQGLGSGVKFIELGFERVNLRLNLQPELRTL
jgi:hypothetical protein